MKLIPASSARWMMRIESSWSVLPQAPNIIAPRQSGLTLTPVLPSLRRSTAISSSGHGLSDDGMLGRADLIEAADRGGIRRLLSDPGVIGGLGENRRGRR